MKFLTICILVIATAVAGSQANPQESNPPHITKSVERLSPGKFFKLPAKECHFSDMTIEESLKACIKIKRRWLHI
jgi:hypothetical protein